MQTLDKFMLLLNSNKIFFYIFTGALSLLSIPLVATQVSSQVNWQLFDFLVMGVLIFTVASTFVLVARKITNRTHLLVTAFLFALGFIYIWAELGVGIFTNLGN